MPDSSRSRFRLEWHLVDSIIVWFHFLSIWKIFVGLAQVRVMYSRGSCKAYYLARTLVKASTSVIWIFHIFFKRISRKMQDINHFWFMLQWDPLPQPFWFCMALNDERTHLSLHYLKIHHNVKRWRVFFVIYRLREYAVTLADKLCARSSPARLHACLGN